MSEPARTPPVKPITPLKTSTTASNDDKMPCDRCGAEIPHARRLALPCLWLQDRLLRMVTAIGRH
jgi:hypothetical protein